MKIDCLSVTDVINQIKALLEGEFRSISLQGEITNLSYSSSGHWYFNLLDDDSSISAALFKMDAYRNPIIKKLKDGDKVVCGGRIGVYAKRGTFQIILNSIMPVGKGNLKAQFEMIKRQLSSEGLFDLDIKKTIPQLPKRIALITSENGAAFHDFINVYSRRSLWTDITLVPSLVQGDEAPSSIRKALKKVVDYSKNAPANKKFDVIVITRGGGSLEDLWAFNDEGLARDVYNCDIPIISAVGHQVDYTIIDYVSDMRCETPSAAAEVVSEEQTRLSERLYTAKRQLINIIKIVLSNYVERLEKKNPNIIINKVLNRYYQYPQRLDELLSKMSYIVTSRLAQYNATVKRYNEMLRVLNPNNILDRGYVIVKDMKERIVGNYRTFNKIENESRLTICFSDGTGIIRKDK